MATSGLRGLDQRVQLVGVGGEPDHLEPRLHEKRARPSRRMSGIVGDGYAHGISARRSCPDRADSRR